MPDAHLDPKASLRLPVEVKQAAQQALVGTGWTLTDVVIASLVLLARRPKSFLKQLEPFRPERRRGRPPKASGSVTRPRAHG